MYWSVICYAVATLANVFASGPDKFLSNDKIHLKFAKIDEYSKIVASLLRKLELDSPLSKSKFVDIAGELQYKTQVGVYQVNKGIATVKNQELHNILDQVAEEAGEITFLIQKYLHKDPERLKDGLAHHLEGFPDLVQKVLKILKTSGITDEVFMNHQLRKATNAEIFALVKLKLEVEFFQKSNAEVELLTDEAVEALYKILKEVQADDWKTHEELVQVAQHLEGVIALAIDKLEDYVSVNQGDGKNSGIAKDASKCLSASHNAFHQLITSDHKSTHIKGEFEKLLKEVDRCIRKLSHVDDNTPGELFLRSILFDGLAVAKVYERQISSSLHHEAGILA